MCAVDLLGFGESQRSTSFSYTIDGHAEAVAEVLQQLPYDRIHLIGHSVGGGVAVKLSQYTGKVVSLLSLEGNLVASDCGLVTRRTASVSEEIFCQQLHPQFRMELLARKESPESFDQAAPYAYYRTACSIVRECDSGLLLPIFKGFKGARAYLYGELSGEIPVVRELAPIPTVAVSNAGHMLMDDNPSELYGAISSVVRSSSFSL
jgi:pimeloyl-ACP methyl ester carboxylesterase